MSKRPFVVQRLGWRTPEASFASGDDRTAQTYLLLSYPIGHSVHRCARRTALLYKAFLLETGDRKKCDGFYYLQGMPKGTLKGAPAFWRELHESHSILSQFPSGFQTDV